MALAEPSIVGKKIERTVYNHYDFYPSGLGKKLIKWLKANLRRLDVIIQRVEALKAIDAPQNPPKMRSPFSMSHVQIGPEWKHSIS